MACSGLCLEATVPQAYALRRQTIPVTLRVVNRAPVEINLNSVSLNHQDTSWNQPLLSGVNYSLVRHVSLGDLPISQPYWLVEPMSPGSYNVQDQTLIGNPENTPVSGSHIQNQPVWRIIQFRQKVIYRYTDPVKGELYQPLTIVPALDGLLRSVFTRFYKRKGTGTVGYYSAKSDEVSGGREIRYA